MTSRLLVDTNLLALLAVRTERWTLGLVDAAVAGEHACAVLTDDLDLYLRLQCDGVTVINFTHLRAQAFGL